MNQYTERLKVVENQDRRKRLEEEKEMFGFKKKEKLNK